MHQHDPRHVDVLVKELGLERGNSVQTPVTHDVTEGEERSSARTGRKLQGVFPSVKISSTLNMYWERVASEDVEP